MIKKSLTLVILMLFILTFGGCMGVHREPVRHRGHVRHIVPVPHPHVHISGHVVLP